MSKKKVTPILTETDLMLIAAAKLLCHNKELYSLPEFSRILAYIGKHFRGHLYGADQFLRTMQGGEVDFEAMPAYASYVKAQKLMDAVKQRADLHTLLYERRVLDDEYARKACENRTKIEKLVLKEGE